MKKVLFSSTALLGALALSAGAQAGGDSFGGKSYGKQAHGSQESVAAGGVSVTLGGFSDFQAGLTDQDSAFETGPNSREVKFRNDNEIHVKVEGNADNGLKYGAVIELEADITADDNGEGTNADKTYLFLESQAGRVELGGNVGAEQALKVDAASIARATGGIDGDWYQFVNTSFSASGFILTPDLPAQHGPLNGASGAIEDASKITYYTPRWNGLQLGASYTPDTGNSGTASGFTSDSNGDFENAFHLGGNYAGDFDGVTLDVGVTGTFGDSETAATEDLAAWNIGAALGFEGFSVAGSYGDWDDSGTPVGANVDGDYWTAGAAYETGPFGVSVTYLDSEFADNAFNNVSVGADYQLAPGLVPYVEVSFFELDETATVVDNDGSVVLVGTQLNF